MPKWWLSVITRTCILKWMINENILFLLHLLGEWKAMSGWLSIRSKRNQLTYNLKKRGKNETREKNSKLVMISITGKALIGCIVSFVNLMITFGPYLQFPCWIQCAHSCSLILLVVVVILLFPWVPSLLFLSHRQVHCNGSTHRIFNWVHSFCHERRAECQHFSLRSLHPYWQWKIMTLAAIFS